jgi:glycosyltransferase involved in cell wall biosynthesis
MNDITVILNCYKRPEYLREQIDAIENQTIKPKEIWIWYNNPEDREQIDLSEEFGEYKIITSNHNFKFHGRFALGLLAQTEYVVFFDDDTIPGSRWFENCFNTLEKTGDAILGTAGVLFTGNMDEFSYGRNAKIGWNGSQYEEIREVDLVGHSWFLKTKNLKYLFYEKPYTWDNGEDIMLSYMAHKYGNIKTFVPPHPKNEQDLWGSKHDTGWDYGTDDNATWKTGSHFNLRNEIVAHYKKDGWIPCRLRKTN